MISAAGTFENHLKTISNAACIKSGAVGWVSLFKASSLFQPIPSPQTQPKTALTQRVTAPSFR